jgi:hypothetical protein
MEDFNKPHPESDCQGLDVNIPGQTHLILVKRSDGVSLFWKPTAV